MCAPYTRKVLHFKFDRADEKQDRVVGAVKHLMESR